MGVKQIPTKKWIKFLKSLGLEYIRTKGDHEVWDYPNSSEESLSRPVIFRGQKKEIPVCHIHTNLMTLGISKKEFEDAIK